MSMANSPAIAALKARLEKQPIGQEGTYKLKVPPQRSEVVSTDTSYKRTPPPHLKHKVSRTNDSPRMKRLSKQLDIVLTHSQKEGSPSSPAKPLQPAPPPPLKHKTGSPGAGRGAVKDGWQHTVFGDTGSQPQDKAASSALSNILHGNPLSGQTGEDREKRREEGSSQVRVKSLPPRVKGRIKSTEFSSGGKVKEPANRLSNSVDGFLNDEEEACSLGKGPRVKEGQRTFVIKCLESSISSNEGDSCDANCEISPDISCRVSNMSGMEDKLVSSSSEEELPSLTSGSTRKGNTVSLCNEPSLDLRSKPLPLPPRKQPPSYQSDKLRSASDLTNSGKEVTVPTASLKSKASAGKPVIWRKPSAGKGKPVADPAKQPPLQGLKPSLSQTTLFLPAGTRPTASVDTVTQKKPNLTKHLSDRRKPQLPPRRVAGKSGTDKVSRSNSAKPPLGKKILPSPRTKPKAPQAPHIGELQGDLFSKRVREQSSSPEMISIDNQEVRDVMTSTNSTFPPEGVVLGSSATMGELEDTLTASQSHDLDTTSVGASGELSGDWIMVLDKKTTKEEEMDEASPLTNGAGSSSSISMKKPPTVLSKPATSSQHYTSNSAETARALSPPLPSSSGSPGTPHNSKPLPSLPSRESLTSEGTLSPPDDNPPELPPDSKVNTLKARFSNSHCAPPLPGTVFSYTGKSLSVEEEVESKGPISAKSSRAKNFAARTLTPSMSSPSIRITSGSTSIHSGDTNSTTHDVVQEWGGVSGRGNTDSGFISEAPDDLVLHRDMTVESFPGVSGTEDQRGVAATPAVTSPVGVAEEEDDVWDETRLEKARKKRLNIALELLETEKTYSGHIKVVAIDFCKMVEEFNKKTRQVIPDSCVYQIFLNIEQIYTLSVNILQELQDRMDAWSTNEAIGDVICRLAPFLKLYSTYTSGFEGAVTTLTDCTKKDRKFDAMVREFERTSISTGLGLASFMLEPVQRIPRYRLLLRDYLKYLPPNSPDKPHTERALCIISEAADLSNSRIRELENSNELLSIQRSLVDYEGTLLVPSRSFIMKGTLLKYSRKSLSPRFFFLFSDILLHMYPPENNVYKFRNEMPLCRMQVEDPRVSLTSFSFNIYSTTRSLILVASSEEEKQLWINSLTRAIQNEVRKTSSLKRDAHYAIHKANTLFGTNAPLMVPDKSVTMCQTCGTEFTLIFRRHHCRACGKVVCSDCSKHKSYLPYLMKMDRVCDICHGESKTPDRPGGGAYVEEGDDHPMSSPQMPKMPKKQDSIISVNSVLNLRGYDDDAVMAGYVLCQEGKKWTKMWYQVKTDCVLYKFKAHEDIKAITSMPLPGYTLVSDASQGTLTLNHHSCVKNFCETFRLEDRATFDSWLSCLGKVINMELDSLVDRPPSPRLGSLEDITEPSPSRPDSHLDNHSCRSRSDSFSTVSSDSQPPSVREVSPCTAPGPIYEN